MSLNTYYKEELAFLQELGSEFAQKYPALAPFLARPSADPDVERLLEGFAFLGGKIRQKLDDEFPEIVTSLMGVLCPQFLRPFPSASIVEFEPLVNRLAKSQQIRSGVSVQSRGAVSCTFRTCGEVTVQPVMLQAASIDSAGTQLMLKFEAFQGVALSTLNIERLRIYLNGDFAFELYQWLCTLVRLCRLVTPNGSEQTGIPLPKPVPAGFEPDRALIPFPATSFQGYRLLQEYLMLPDKFLFVEFRGLGSLTKATSSSFTIQCDFQQEVPRSWRLSKDNFRLHCAPVVNLFTDESNPVDVSHERREYRLTPPRADAEVYSVNGANAWIAGTAQAKRYEPFLSLEQDPQNTYYSVQVRTGVDNVRRDTFVSLTKSTVDSLQPARETAVFSLLCTNGTPAAQVKPGEINGATDDSPDFARFRNLTRVSAYVPVSDAPERVWQLLSNLVLSPTTLSDVSSLRSTLRLYNCPEEADPQLSRANARRIEGIQKLHSEAADYVITPELDPERQFKRRYGLPIRGTRLHLTVEGTNFTNSGDLYLFGTVLDRFFSQYATLNSLTQLFVTDSSTGQEYSWQPRLGEQMEF